MADQPSKLPQAGEVWRKGDEERHVIELLELRPGVIVLTPKNPNTVRYSMTSPDGRGTLSEHVDAWLEWTKDAERIA